jgi:hypothetical protein
MILAAILLAGGAVSWSDSAAAATATSGSAEIYSYDSAPKDAPLEWATSRADGGGGAGRVVRSEAIGPPASTPDNALTRSLGSPNATNTVDDLDWSIVKQSTGETRYQHVSAHNVPNIDKASHGVFIDDAVTTTNEAWTIVQRTGAQPVSSGGVSVYTVPMGRNVGFAGGANANQLAGVPHTSVQIIVKPGTNQIITAYPVVP